MAAALCTVHFHARHEVAVVHLGCDRSGLRLIETRPAAPTVVLRFRVEELGAAPGALEHAFPVLLVERTRSRALGALLAQDAVLLRSELALPLVVRLLDRRLVRRVHVASWALRADRRSSHESTEMRPGPKRTSPRDSTPQRMCWPSAASRPSESRTWE